MDSRLTVQHLPASRYWARRSEQRNILATSLSRFGPGTNSSNALPARSAKSLHSIARLLRSSSLAIPPCACHSVPLVGEWCFTPIQTATRVDLFLMLGIDGGEVRS